MLTKERLIQILREIYGDCKFAESEEELYETCRELKITREEAEEIGCPSMTDYINCEPHSFIDDKEKMVDFSMVARDRFLRLYPYISEKDYDETIRDMIKRTNLDNKKDYIEEAETLEGTEISQIIMSQMMIEWLNKEEK